MEATNTSPSNKSSLSKNNQNNLFFSSDDSANTDNSFNSSGDEENFEKNDGLNKQKKLTSTTFYFH